MHPYIIIGFGVATLLYILRLVYAWFPLNPVGLYLGGIGPLFPMGSAAPVALLLKCLTFEIGGTKLYEEKGVSHGSRRLHRLHAIPFGWRTSLYLAISRTYLGLKPFFLFLNQGICL
jgi:hypothetical protein